MIIKALLGSHQVSDREARWLFTVVVVVSWPASQSLCPHSNLPDSATEAYTMLLGSPGHKSTNRSKQRLLLMKRGDPVGAKLRENRHEAWPSTQGEGKGEGRTTISTSESPS